MNNEKIKNIISKALDPSVINHRNRKLLTEGKSVTVSYEKNGKKRNFVITTKDKTASVKVGFDEYIELPFVPYSQIDIEYENSIRSLKNSEFSIDDNLLDEYLSRF